jgi:hypothetical protein
MLATQLLHFHQAGLAQDTQVFGDVVLRDLETIRDLAHVERSIHEQSDDPDTRLLTERLERDDTIVRGGAGCGVLQQKEGARGRLRRSRIGHGGRVQNRTAGHRGARLA